MDFQPALGVTGAADYGLDTISIGDAISVPEQIVGIVNSTEFLLGSLGLGVIPSNFSSKNQATFLSSMVENQSVIPSHSYGYTAGAYYREDSDCLARGERLNPLRLERCASFPNAGRRGSQPFCSQ